MRRFVTSVVLFLFAIPFGVSVSGCKHAIAPVFCNNGDTGITTGQITNITLQPIVYGISLNMGQMGQAQLPIATDCKGDNITAPTYTYSTTDMTIADINPSNGHLCAGTWNRNSGGGIADYTYCNSTGKSGVAYIEASAGGATSNPLPVFVHPVVTSIVLGGASANCATDPTTDCAPISINSNVAPTANGACPTSAAYPSNPQLANGCCSIPPNTVLSASVTAYNATSCVSQNQTRQLIARAYAGSQTNLTNISCQVGHLIFNPASSTVVSIDQNGVATAAQPGSTLISANIADASSSAGFFSTCPPASITLSAPGASGNAPVSVNQNNPLPLSASVRDTQGNIITGLNLEYVSTTPITIPALSSTITPALAGAASITAICQPNACNPSAYNQIGISGNGVPVTSNSVNIVSPGTNSTVLYMASTQSRYLAVRDFTQPGIGQPLQLPYLPNSMIISNDGASIYMGSSTGLMSVSALTLSVPSTDLTAPGIVLGISPDGNTLILTDPVKGTITVRAATGITISTYGGVGTHAEFTPDSQTAYITAGNQLLVFNTVTGWTVISPATTSSTPVTDVAVTVPAVGAYFAGPVTTARAYCPITTLNAGSTSATNVFYPPADNSAAITDRIAATNDGLHILGATVSPTPTLNDLRVNIPSANGAGPTVSIACPLTPETSTTPATTGPLAFSSTFNSLPLGITASAIDGVLTASDSSVAFVTYTGSGGVLPAYMPAASGPGALTDIPLTAIATYPAPTAPLAGTISSDNSTVYVGTSGDNLVHLIDRSTLTDKCSAVPTPACPSLVIPGLVSPSGAAVPVDLMVQKPRKTT